MTSQGQRFRRRALRRGYKVDEVDSFLDRVEATLNGDRVDSPVRSGEVRDVVFRVRFGGYDEWQVDLHLDRVERQLADQEPADHAGDRMPADRLPDRMGSDRMGSDRMPERMMPERMPDRIPERMPERLPERLPDRMPTPGIAAASLAGGGLAPAGPYDRPPGDRGQGDRSLGLPPRDDRPVAPPVRDERMMPPGGGGRSMAPAGPPPGWSESAATAGRPAPAPTSSGFARGFDRPDAPTFGPDFANDPYADEPTYSGFEPSRRTRPDMTTEMRLPDASPVSAPPPLAPAGPSGPGPAPSGGSGAIPPGDVQRIDQMRRTFQLRRFGSGYDRVEVDRLFEGIISAMSGRSAMPIGDSELDPQQFQLVPGGYFESEVDQALREVRDIIHRR